mgnify:CR=1 FL=1
METTTNQSKANTWMRKRAADCIARGWTLSYGMGSGAIISPKLCEKLKQAEEKKRKSKSDEEKER